MTSMADKTAIVTGGGAGIGLAITLGMAAAGCSVGLIDIAADDLRGASAKIDSMNRRVSVATADVADGDAVLSAVDKLGDELGAIDILVNCAGILRLEHWRN
jgi:3-oxoacyl-[acyl-carrier protein] reductase